MYILHRVAGTGSFCSAFVLLIGGHDMLSMRKGTGQ